MLEQSIWNCDLIVNLSEEFLYKININDIIKETIEEELKEL